MARLSFLNSLRCQLMALVLLVVLPAVGVIVYSGIEERNHARADALKDCLHIAQTIAMTQERIIDGAHKTLLTLSQLSPVQHLDKKACAIIFSRLLKDTKGHTNFGLLSPQGDLWASALPFPRPVTMADRTWFQQLVKTRDFAIGGYQKGFISGKVLINLGYPLLDTKGRLKAIVFTGLDLDWIRQSATKLNLPPGSTLNVMDSQGITLVRNLEPGEYEGRSTAHLPFIKTILAGKEGVLEAQGQDGVPRLFGFSSFGQPYGTLSVRVGIPRKVAFAQANWIMKRNLIFLGIMAVVVLLFTKVFGESAILRPIQRLLEVTKQMEQGNLEIRLNHRFKGFSEIHELRESFNQMAQAIEERQENLKHAEKETRKAQHHTELILNSAGEGIMGLDLEGKHTFVNQAGARMLGYEPGELIGRSSHRIWHHSRADGSPYPEEDCPVYQAFREGRATHVREEVFWRKDGSSFFTAYTSTPIMEAGIIKGAVLNFWDISERKQEQELQARLAAILESTTSGVATYDQNLNLLYVNKAGRLMVGLKADEDISGRRAEDFLSQENKARIFEKILPAGMLQENWQGEISLLSLEGQEIPVSLVGLAHKTAGGNIAFFSTLFRDITERKLAEGKIQETLDKLREALGGIIQVISQTVELRDPYTAGHQRRVADLSRAMAQEMGLSSDQVDSVRIAGVIHDLGKISVPIEILSKPTKLCNLEFSLIKAHAQNGYEILKKIAFPWPIARIVREHHERMDGSGYPQGLSNGNILLEARILAVADVVEAISSHRPYRPSLGLDKALQEIAQNRGTFYDPQAVDACLRLFTEKGFTFA